MAGRSTSSLSRPPRPPGMTDVARLAGVSQKTVSRVINNEPNVSAHVRERVLDAAQSLGYRRNTAARELIMGRSHRIGVVSLGTVLYGPASLLVALQRAAQSTGYALSVVTTLEGDTGIQQAVDGLLDQGVEGIVLSEPIDEGKGTTVSCPVPVLTLGRMPGLRSRDVLVEGADGAAAGRMATEHLLGLGHATVWHVSGPRHWWAAVDRLQGWHNALTAARATRPAVLEGDWTPASGYEAGRALARRDGVTAVFAANDDMAIGVMRALREAGMRVPEQVSVVGMDDVPVAAYVSPPLTTVCQDFDAVAVRGLERLVRRIEGAHSHNLPGDRPAHLVVRESTGPPPPA